MDNAVTEQIENAREVGLSVLQPSARELEHGLALHREALVVDLYGFSPRGRIDAAPLRALHEAGASDEVQRMAREELGLTGSATDDAQWAVARQAWQASGVTGLFQNAGEEAQTVKILLKRLANFTYVTDARRDDMVRGLGPRDVLTAKERGMPCLFLTCNGVPLAEDWRSPAEELWYIHLFHQLGCRMMHLTYNRSNMLGGGCGDRSDSGLTDLGAAAVAEMNRCGMIVDVAHSGWRTSREAAELSSAPIVASHTVCNGLHEHIRAKPDDTIRAIVEQGGVVGICAVPFFLGGSGDLAALLDHVDYVCKRFGAEFAAVGTDQVFTDRSPADALSPLPKTRPFTSLWPEGSYGSEPKWQEPRMVQSLSWTNWPLITVGLVQRGHSDADIRKIIGGNALRVAAAVLGQARGW